MRDLAKVKKILHENDANYNNMCEFQMELFEDHVIRLTMPNLELSLYDDDTWNMKLKND